MNDMNPELKDNLPESFEDALEKLKYFFSEHLDKIKSMSEVDFAASVHFSSGMHIRNSWQLWWFEEHSYENKGWNKEKPKLNAWFNSLGIYHADDMSVILMDSFHRYITGKPIELKKQVKHYKKYWRGQGFKGGIFKPN